MIEKLELLNYRCFSKHSVSFRKNTILVGENNAGKSTIIEALRIISVVVSKYKYLTYKNVPNWLDIPAGHKGVMPSLKEYDFNLSTVFYRYGKPPAQLRANFTDGESISIYIGENEQVFAVLRDRKNDVIDSKKQANNVYIPTIKILPLLTPLEKEERKIDKNRVQQYLFSRLSSRHFRNELLLYPESYKKFKELVEATWHSCRITALDQNDTGEYVELSLFVRDEDFTAEVGWMGHGLQMWLQIMWFLSFVNDEDIVILDEPDIYMHADLQRKIIKLLIKEIFKQVIVATHSLEIISEVLPENILVVDRKRKVSKFTDSIPAVQKIIDNIGGVHNIQLTKLWKCKKCLILEGKDLKILRHLHRTLFPTSENPLDIIPNMSIGGWSGWKYAIGSSMFLKNAADESIKTYCILDRDYYTKEQLLEVFIKAEENGVKLHIWKRKEIENYLIVPDTIYRIINSATPSKKEIKVEYIIEEIDKICEDIKNDTFDAIANQIATIEKKDYHKANRKARSILNENWASFDKKVSLVSGKLVISKLSKWSQDNYQVSFNPEKIANELKCCEILPEVKELLEAIEINNELNSPIKIHLKEASHP